MHIYIYIHTYNIIIYIYIHTQYIYIYIIQWLSIILDSDTVVGPFHEQATQGFDAFLLATAVSSLAAPYDIQVPGGINFASPKWIARVENTELMR
jgi:hypothetical protein